ncbi:Cysteine-rich receptor-like protein kinase 25 [Ananas comosus]|uniref:Cysteine-rich receptor-like protein kinase 25 n=1 Tax=Ananas comosus TaxID=4615 RepID=A0A199VX87_ANACO|nr:Cysteine-rich receptor-like protein kinase 25 [Ananas comosus]
MNAVADRAANDTQRRFATGEVTNFTEAFPTIYGLAQCTPDLSASDCRQCLGGLIGEMPQYFAGRQGGGSRRAVQFEVRGVFLLRRSACADGFRLRRQPHKKKNVTSTVLAVTIPLVTAFVIISTICICFWRRRRSAPKGPLYYDGDAEEIKSAESLLIDLATLRAATANFAGENKLGEGGFGAVYKGLLPDGREIAVKRLSKDSGQGLGELKNELFLVAKLQHKNLVRLLGVCLEEQEKLLVYEYVPNRSLDTILFDSEKRGWLDWGRRYKIINGIARGLLYLHEDSQLKVVHRDLKASNILLDAEMNPKISDFGLARLFGGDHSQEITRRVVGTFGYMAPEYAMHGYFSNKSDVFSFGVMVLEIVTGRKNAGSFNSEQSEDLINYTWENWTKGTITEIVDSSLDNRYPRSEVLRCIHIGLLCVQENPADRPNMSRVVVMLSSSTVTLETPSKPAFCIGMSSMQFNMYSNASKYHGLVAEQSSSKSIPPSPNEVSITELEPSSYPSTMSCSTLIFFCLLFFLLLHPPPAAAAVAAPDLLTQVCGTTGNYTANSSYQSNLNDVLSFLSSNASASPSGFAATTLGRSPDEVSGLALCRGDVNATDCRACLNVAVQDAPQICPATKAAHFLASTDNSPETILMNTQNITGADSNRFNRLVAALMNAMADRAANDTKRRYATGEVTNFTQLNPTIYGLVQCTPDLSASDCRQCLGGLIGEMPNFLAGRLGGRILGTRCNFRYEVYPFYDGAPSLMLSAAVANAPAPAPPVGPTPIIPTAEKGKKKNVTSTVLAIAVPLVTAFVLISTICICFWRRRTGSALKEPLHYGAGAEEIKSVESLLMDLSTLRTATANFAEENKLGEGGFGAVYKGLLPDGQEIAVKRLSKDSRQGLGELKNELVLVAKLQHKNLVRLLGVCLEEQEKLLVYEYVPNRSLDTILFDSEKRGWLDWGKRFKIISGIARGLLGYMAPEYAMHGYFSNKSDVFSFGVLVLEIVTGRKNTGSFNSEQAEDLLNYIWENWKKGTITEIVDSFLGNVYPRSEVVRCIHIGLLCVQENPADRPTMSSVIVMLSSNTVTLETPSKPAFCIGMSSMQLNTYSNGSNYRGLVADQPSSKSVPPSPNEVSITELEPSTFYINCPANYTANSIFQSNLNLLLSSLPSEAAPSGFYNISVGRSGADQVYGLALCRGDVSSADCNACLTRAAQDAVAKCPRGMSSTLWYDDCMLRYSNNSFFGIADSSPLVYLSNVQNVTDPQLFDDQLGQLMKSLAMKAAYGSGRPPLFAVGEVNFTSFNNIYGLVQCTRDLSPTGCYGCLSSYIGSIPQCCSTKIGGRIEGENCIVRFESAPFYNLAPSGNEAPPPMPQSNGTSTTTPSPPARLGQNTGNGSSQTGGKGTGGINGTTKTIIIVAISVVAAALLLLSAIFLCLRIRKKQRKPVRNALMINGGDDQEIRSAESLLFDLATIRAATSNFSEANKLGEGGFGPVYKGMLHDGQEIAVKRLSMSSVQGLVELKNEVVLVAKLQHRNLVRLIGCCLEEQEKLLIYEYLPNTSLDKFLFDPVRREQLDWIVRYKIIEGISRGLLYLHEDSRLKIVHRDLKASNILLDAFMTPKISDFGLAKLFDIDTSEGNTSRIAGTYGYMAPEYVIHGHFSTKSDVFSYGVLLLEIVTGRRNARSQETIHSEDVLSYVWKHWTEGTAHEVLDPSLAGQCRLQDVLRCIHIGLLCVQDDPSNRPSMASVVLMLSSLSFTLPAPSAPAFVILHGSTAENTVEIETDASSGLQRRTTRAASVNKKHVKAIIFIYPT